MIIRLLVVANVMPTSGKKQKKNVNVDAHLPFEGLLNSLKKFEEGS